MLDLYFPSVILWNIEQVCLKINYIHAQINLEMAAYCDPFLEYSQYALAILRAGGSPPVEKSVEYFLTQCFPHEFSMKIFFFM